MSNKNESIKYRVGVLLFLILVMVNYYNSASYQLFAKAIALSIMFALIFVVIFVKYKLINKNYIKGIGVFVFIASTIFWKKLHSYPIIIEMTYSMVLGFISLALTFIYSASELEGNKKAEKPCQ